MTWTLCITWNKEATESVHSKLNELDGLIEVFKSGDEIRQLLGMILNLGNYLNGGNRTRGQADGFQEMEILLPESWVKDWNLYFFQKLDMLAKLRDIKMNSGGNLILFLDRQFCLSF